MYGKLHQIGTLGDPNYVVQRPNFDEDSHGTTFNYPVAPLPVDRAASHEALEPCMKPLHEALA